ncbi:alpha/beta fold hydrolase [Dongia sedimenti]|uniref:Alpha/beta hydrolase n=1 Tax=Dongia sedimenti TaxID=3064282 RepID=A0ABU0YPB3_9PROT|nr:alpha/beta hydrolase [Rhodospirillaceae bacterium R-7]
MTASLRHARTSALDIAYEESGAADGAPIFLMHGFPDDVRTWDGVTAPLAAQGYRVIVPFLRGYGPTRFLSPNAMRSGQQGAIGSDLKELMDTLGIARTLLAGYDWGGRAACIVAALWPERVRGLVSIGGYNIQNIARNVKPEPADQEWRFWYQWYFNTARGVAGLAANRHDLCRLIWKMWSPNWAFDDATYDATGAAFDNPDFVDIVIHSYRHRYQAAPSDPAYEDIERRLALRPKIVVPTIVLHGAADEVDLPHLSEHDAPQFTASYRREVVPRAGHFFPREAPQKVVDALLELAKAERS